MADSFQLMYVDIVIFEDAIYVLARAREGSREFNHRDSPLLEFFLDSLSNMQTPSVCLSKDLYDRIMSKSRTGLITLLGIYLSITYGWGLSNGEAPVKYWVLFFLGLGAAICGILFLVGVLKTKERSPQEECLVNTGICIGWGACAVLSWIDKGCTFDSNSLLNFIVLIVLIILTIRRAKE